jgi:trimethylamine:corrinoid methyltransferase-like protein
MMREVGPRGMFLKQKQSAKELPRLWAPTILFEDSDSPDERYRNAFEVADEAIRWILENHEPEPLAEDVRQELRRIVDTADKDENLKREIKGH